MKLLIVSDATYKRIKDAAHIIEELDPGGLQTIADGIEHFDGRDEGSRAFLAGLIQGTAWRIQAGVPDFADVSDPIVWRPKD